MVHEGLGQRKKAKPRGRPFAKGNKRGKLENDVLAPTGCQSSDGREVVALPFEASLYEEIESGLMVCLDESRPITAPLEKKVEEVEINEAVQDPKALELIETIEFKNGENVLELRFSKRHNRMYRIQIFLNKETEIRPVTYTGASSGGAFWDLLKGALRK